MKRNLCIALHDVAPATWPQCRVLLDMLDELRATAVTLLVVPDFHRQGRVDRDAAFIADIDARLRGGDEVALHGYFHTDDASPPQNFRQWFKRRILTAGEGEFAAIDSREILPRLRNGIDALARAGWHVRGFVPPAWLASAETRMHLRELGFHYTTTHRHLIDLRSAHRHPAPCITASPRSAWRRSASRAWMRIAYRMTRSAPLLRIGLHPADAGHPELLEAWRRLLVQLLAERELLTKSHALDSIALAADRLDAVLDMPGETPAEV